MSLVIVVLATTEDGLPEAKEQLAALGLPVEGLATQAPSDTRRLILIPTDDDAQAACLVARLRAEGRHAVMRSEAGPRLDSWVRHTEPVAVGDRLTICFVWSEHDRRGLPNLLEIDPGGGFGAGAHPATRLVLEELVARITGGERVLDVGCGSGVLALSALRLGASSAVGVDIDPPAIEATTRNAALNGFADRVVAANAPLAEIDGTFDVVVANIGWAPIVELAADLTARVAPGGWLAVSGITAAHSSRVIAALRPLEVIGQRTEDEWTALVLAARPVNSVQNPTT
jgi:ribosomal protein L11 methyltransferase